MRTTSSGRAHKRFRVWSTAVYPMFIYGIQLSLESIDLKTRRWQDIVACSGVDVAQRIGKLLSTPSGEDSGPAGWSA